VTLSFRCYTWVNTKSPV